MPDGCDVFVLTEQRREGPHDGRLKAIRDIRRHAQRTGRIEQAAKIVGGDVLGGSRRH
jgi:hypothetical protein